MCCPYCYLQLFSLHNSTKATTSSRNTAPLVVLTLYVVFGVVTMIYRNYCCSLVKEFSVKACKECRFSHGGQYFAAVNGNTISIYNTYTFENVGNLRLVTVILSHPHCCCYCH